MRYLFVRRVLLLLCRSILLLLTVTSTRSCTNSLLVRLEQLFDEPASPAFPSALSHSLTDTTPSPSQWKEMFGGVEPYWGIMDSNKVRSSLSPRFPVLN
jgi:hypothetical protein